MNMYAHLNLNYKAEQMKYHSRALGNPLNHMWAAAKANVESNKMYILLSVAHTMYFPA